ncbi:MAG: hypothetical protein ACUZ8E_06380 [Candidatus Anammoxibacter sp.]
MIFLLVSLPLKKVHNSPTKTPIEPEILTKPFLSDIKAVKKDRILLERLHKKMDQILQNPEHYPIKRFKLKGK